MRRTAGAVGGVASLLVVLLVAPGPPGRETSLRPEPPNPPGDRSATGPVGASEDLRAVPPPQDEVEPRFPTADEQLAYARSRKAARSAAPPADRERATWRAIEAYPCVRRYHPRASASVAEAAFRAGRMLAALGRSHDARDEFDVAVRRGVGTPFRARARLESARLWRNDGEAVRALELLREVAYDVRAAPEHRDEAWLGIGDTWSSLARRDEAWKAWKRVARDGTAPWDRVAAYDRLGLSSIERGDLEGAAGFFNACLRDVGTIALERTERGARTRRSLDNMRLVDALPRAIAARRATRRATSSSKDP